MAPGDTRRLAIRARTESQKGNQLAVGVERLVLLALPVTGRVSRDLRGVADGGFRSGEAKLEEAAGALVYRWVVSR